MRTQKFPFVRLILIVLFTLASIFPFLWMLANSFMSPENIFSTPPKFIPDLLFTNRMWENYRKVMGVYNFGHYVMNSIVVVSFSAIGQLLVCSLSGFAFAKMRFRGKNLLFALLMVTLMVPVQVVIIPEYYLMMTLGWLDTYLPLIVPSFLAGAMGTFMLKEFYEQVPEALFDAGIIDGVNAAQMYARIFVPQSIAPIATLFIIAFMNNWNDLLRPMLYISTPKLYTVTLGLIVFQGQYDNEWNLLLAASVISVLPLIVVFIFCQRYIIESSMNAGIKG